MPRPATASNSWSRPSTSSGSARGHRRIRTPSAAAVDRGRAVLCEKPLAPTLAECEEVSGLLSRVPHQVGLVLRHAPVFQAFAAAVASGDHGRPLAALLRDDQYFPIQGMYGSDWRADVGRAGEERCSSTRSTTSMSCGGSSVTPQRVSARVASRFGHAGIDDVADVTSRVRRRAARDVGERVAPDPPPPVDAPARGVLRGRPALGGRRPHRTSPCRDRRGRRRAGMPRPGLGRPARARARDQRPAVAVCDPGEGFPRCRGRRPDSVPGRSHGARRASPGRRRVPVCRRRRRAGRYRDAAR